ncbi:MAG: GDSL-type esterase/lipase family protein [Saprospiraceae bacterium]|nr:GDSL-type esterase/lipase family protein [Saprospiraceae bacterium]
MKRRDFFTASSTAALSTMIPKILGDSGLVYKTDVHLLPEKLTIVFQGDSITDAHRDKASYYANNARGMGVGYVHMIVSELLGSNSGTALQCYNRGISGHKVHQLVDRWENDCLQLQPDILSILIGVNDFWHTLDWGYDGTVQVYEKDLRQLLTETRNAFPDIRLIMGEPFAVAGGTAMKPSWSAFHDYRHVAKRIAGDFQAAFIPYHSIFEKALDQAPVNYWCPDGVHPSLAGAYLMKEAWISTFLQMFGE